MAEGSGRFAQQFALLLVLLGIFAGAAHWNYQRNLSREAAEVRPFRSLSDRDLTLLLEATESEVASLDAARSAALGAPEAAPAKGGRWSAFENAQRKGRQVRELGFRVSEHEASIREMKKELARRAAMGDETSVLLRRIFVYTP